MVTSRLGFLEALKATTSCYGKDMKMVPTSKDEGLETLALTKSCTHAPWMVSASLWWGPIVFRDLDEGLAQEGGKDEPF